MLLDALERITEPQWSPVMKTGNTLYGDALEPECWPPQWSPVMKTGNTAGVLAQPVRGRQASMEPGHEDREYRASQDHECETDLPQWSPVMKTGNTRQPLS